MTERPRLLITGGSRGIGAAIALAAARCGARVALNHRASPNAAEGVAAAVTEVGGEALVLQGDVREFRDVEQVFARVGAEWGGIDWLVNNAHTPYRHARADELEWSDYEEQFAGTVRAAFNTIRAALPLLLRSATPAILNVSSITVSDPVTGLAARNTAKAALEGFTRSLAHEYGPQGIRVNAIAVGWTKTDQLKMVPPDLLAEIQGRTPLKKVASPEEIADTAIFLLSSRAAFITGLVLPVAGGVAPGIGS
jgi:3-oxoacyl-[acyl-carrier protein] reductase